MQTNISQDRYDTFTFGEKPHVKDQLSLPEPESTMLKDI